MKLTIISIFLAVSTAALAVTPEEKKITRTLNKAQNMVTKGFNEKTKQEERFLKLLQEIPNNHQELNHIFNKAWKQANKGKVSMRVLRAIFAKLNLSTPEAPGPKEVGELAALAYDKNDTLMMQTIMTRLQALGRANELSENHCNDSSNQARPNLQADIKAILAKNERKDVKTSRSLMQTLLEPPYNEEDLKKLFHSTYAKPFDLTITDPDGNTVLHLLAVAHGSHFLDQMVQNICLRQDSPNNSKDLECMRVILSKKNLDGLTPLQLSAKTGNVDRFFEFLMNFKGISFAQKMYYNNEMKEELALLCSAIKDIAKLAPSSPSERKDRFRRIVRNTMIYDCGAEY